DAQVAANVRWLYRDALDFLRIDSESDHWRASPRDPAAGASGTAATITVDERDRQLIGSRPGSSREHPRVWRRHAASTAAGCRSCVQPHEILTGYVLDGSILAHSHSPDV